MCVADQYSIAYPPGWVAHPRDVDLGIPECTFFGEDPLRPAIDEEGRWVGIRVVVWLGRHCRGSFDRAVTEEQIEVQGFPAWKREVADGHAPAAAPPSAYEYFVDLTPGAQCEVARWLQVRTESIAPGGLEGNNPIVDRMVASLRFATD